MSLLWAQSAHADRLSFPVACDLGRDCFIQQYVDRDPGQGVADYTCGPLSYDGHRGTDIRLINRAQMRDGVAVVAVASGTVKSMRDGMMDNPRKPVPDKRACGNGVLIMGADGWRYLYCHLRRGSVTVRNGDVVDAGTPLGLVGQSGRAQFPHLHLEIRDQAGRVMDPFDARQQDESCKLRERRTLWRDLERHSYQPGGVLDTGFADLVPEYADIRDGTAAHDTLPTGAPAVVFWAHLFGLREGDRLTLTLTGPSGDVLARQVHHIGRTQATLFRALGRRSNGRWPAGAYHGRVELIREAVIIEARSETVELR